MAEMILVLMPILGTANHQHFGNRSMPLTNLLWQSLQYSVDMYQWSRGIEPVLWGLGTDEEGEGGLSAPLQPAPLM